MPKKQVPHDVVCATCNKEYTVMTAAYDRTIKSNKDFVCSSCRGREAQKKLVLRVDVQVKKSDTMKSNYDNMSESQKKELVNKRRDAVKRYWELLSYDQYEEISKKRSDDTIRILSMSDNSDRYVKSSNTKRERFKNMSIGEYESYCNNRKRISRSMFDDNNPDIQRHRDRMTSISNNRWKNMSDDERRRISINMTKRNNDFWNGDDIDKQNKIKRTLIDAGRDYWESLSDDDIKHIYSKIRMSWERKSEDDINLMRDSIIRRWELLPEEERLKRIAHLQKINRDYWDNISETELNKRSKFMTKRNNDFWNGDDIDKQNKIKRTLIDAGRDYWESLSDDEMEMFSKIHKNNWDKKSNKEKLKISAKLKLESRKYWDTMTDIERKRISEHMTERNNKFWKNMSDDERVEYIRKMHNAKGNNGLHVKFENMFNNSILSEKFNIINEVVLTNNGVTHAWDYGVYDNTNGSLKMAIDLDGAFYHADICDYNGKHSKQYYDERRYLSCHDGVMICILYELQLNKSFNHMMKLLMNDYDDYVKSIFKMCRTIPFPYPHYNDKELMNSYKNLLKVDETFSINNRIGDRIVSHFHNSIYSANRYGYISPFDAWHNDSTLIKVIKNRTIYQNHLNPNKILQGFNVSKIAPKVSVFSPGRAKMLICKYLSEYDEIIDPFSGFSGRLLGAIACGKKYVGNDISSSHYNETANLIQYLNNAGIEFDAMIINSDINNISGIYESLFTCSPYRYTEQWSCAPNIYDHLTCDDWIDICMERFECKRYMFIINDTIKYYNNIVEKIPNRSHMSDNNEYVVIIDK